MIWRMARLLARPKPRFSALAISLTCGNAAATASAVPSDDALSTTYTSALKPLASRSANRLRSASSSEIADVPRDDDDREHQVPACARSIPARLMKLRRLFNSSSRHDEKLILIQKRREHLRARTVGDGHQRVGQLILLRQRKLRRNDQHQIRDRHRCLERPHSGTRLRAGGFLVHLCRDPRRIALRPMPRRRSSRPHRRSRALPEHAPWS